MEVKIEIKTDPQRVRPENSEVERLLADNRKAKKLLGWEPRYAGKEGFRKGLLETIAWFSKPEKLKTYKTDRYTV